MRRFVHAGVVAGCIAVACVPADATLPAMPAQGDAVDVSALESATSTARWVDAPLAKPRGYVAVVVAPRAVDLSPSVQGTLVEQKAALGQHVDAGEVVAVVQAPALLEQIDAAEAALSGANAGLAGARLDVAEARRERDRERALVGHGASTAEARERAEAALGQANSEVREHLARVAERKAELRRLRALRGAGEVRAPFAGRVGAWFQAPGSVAAPGDALVRLTASDQLWVRFAVPSADADVEGLEVGKPVTVHPADTRDRAHATIAQIAPDIDLASQMIVVEARLHDSANLRPGQAGRVRLASPAARPSP